MNAVAITQFLLCIATTCAASLTKVGVVHQEVTLRCRTTCGGTKWTRDGELVLECRDGICEEGPGFKNRVRIDNNCDLIINQLKYNDEGTYMGTCDDGQPLKLYVVAPVVVTVTAGDKAVLPCYAATKADAKPYNLWTKDDEEQVLLFENRAFTYGKKMKVWASEEGYRSGDYSLHIDDALPSDSGLYICDYSEMGDQEKFQGAPRAFQLNVQAKKDAFQISIGGWLDLPIPDSAEVTFNKADGIGPPEDVCHINGRQVQRSSPKYAGRVTVANNVLTLTDINSGDAGEYSVKKDGEVFGVFSVIAASAHQGDAWPTSAIVVVTLLCVILVLILVGWLSYRYVGWGRFSMHRGTAKDRRSDTSAGQYKAAPLEDSQDVQLSIEELPDRVPEVDDNQLSVPSMETGSHSPMPWEPKGIFTVEEETSSKSHV